MSVSRPRVFAPLAALLLASALTSAASPARAAAPPDLTVPRDVAGTLTEEITLAGATSDGVFVVRGAQGKGALLRGTRASGAVAATGRTVDGWVLNTAGDAVAWGVDGVDAEGVGQFQVHRYRNGVETTYLVPNTNNQERPIAVTSTGYLAYDSFAWTVTYHATNTSPRRTLLNDIPGVSHAEADDTGAMVHSDEGGTLMYASLDGTVIRTLSSTEIVDIAMSSSTLAWIEREPYTGVHHVVVAPRTGGTPTTVATGDMTAVALHGDVVAWLDGSAVHVRSAAGAVRDVPVANAVATDLIDDGTSFLVAARGTAAQTGVVAVPYASGSATRILTVPPGPVSYAWPTLTSGNLVYGQDSGPSPTQIPLFTRQIGQATTVPTLAQTTTTLSVSVPVERDGLAYVSPPVRFSAARGTRTVVGSGGAGVSTVLFDRGHETVTIPGGDPADGAAVSGPYVLVGDAVYLADGTKVRDIGPHEHAALFGSRVAWTTTSGDIRYADVALPVSATNPRTIPSPEPCHDCKLSIRGDLISWRSGSYSRLFAHSLSTGQLCLFEDSEISGAQAGDGFVAYTLGSPESGPTKVRFAEAVPLTSYPPSTIGTGTLQSVDGNDVLWSDLDGNLHVTRLALPRAPQVLGVLAPAAFTPDGDSHGDTWSPQVDFTGQVPTVTVTISRGGSVVRTLTGSAPDGSARDLTWDGKDAEGKTVGAGTYHWTVSGAGVSGPVTDLSGTGPAHGSVEVSGVPGASALRFVPLAPARVFDTRTGLGVAKLAIPAKTAISVKVTGVGGVPATDVAAVALTVTATAPTKTGYLTVWPSGEARPLASHVVFAPGQSVANLVIAKVGPDGRINLYNSAGTTQVIGDVAGWYPDEAFIGLTPARVLDTRTGIGTAKVAVPAKGTISVAVTGVGGVPVNGVGAVALTLTATGTTKAGYLTVWPHGETKPLASNVAFAAGQSMANLVIAKVGTGGKIDIYNSNGSTQIIGDVAGWFPTGASYTGLTPARVLDTRNGIGAAKTPVPAKGTISVKVTGVGGVPTTGVGAVALTVTATAPTKTGYLTVWPHGLSKPLASNVVFAPGQSVANLVIAKVGTDGKIDIYNSNGSTQIIGDVAGWFPAS